MVAHKCLVFPLNDIFIIQRMRTPRHCHDGVDLLQVLAVYWCLWSHNCVYICSRDDWLFDTIYDNWHHYKFY